MTTATCIYGFEWTGTITAEHSNTFIIECDETKTRHVVRKDIPRKRCGYVEDEAHGKFETKEELLRVNHDEVQRRHYIN